MSNESRDTAGGAVRPEDVLPDHSDRAEFQGLTVRKGTVAAFLQNAIRWSDPATSREARNAIEEQIAASAPALRALGVFDVFELKDGRLRALMNDF